MGEIPDLSYPEQLPYLINYTAMFMLLCFTKAMNLELSPKSTQEGLNFSFRFPSNSYVCLGRQRISLSIGKCGADICQKDKGLLLPNTIV